MGEQPWVRAALEKSYVAHFQVILAHSTLRRFLGHMTALKLQVDLGGSRPGVLAQGPAGKASTTRMVLYTVLRDHSHACKKTSKTMYLTRG